MTWKEDLMELVRHYEFTPIEELEDFITSLLKKQRENCYKNYLHGFSDDKDWDKNAILNAPEPKRKE